MDKQKINEIKDIVQKILNGIMYDGKEMVNAKACADFIGIMKDIDIRVYKTSFSKMNTLLSDYGAMMMRTAGITRNIANIYLNADKDPVFQRFSLIHELGHILFDKYTIDEVKDKIIISTHINYRLFYIPDTVADNNKELQREQYANIFALELLMPESKVKELEKDSKDYNELSLFFGVDEVAVKTRMELLKE